MRHTAMLLFLLAGTAQAGVSARAFDAITSPGEPVAIAAKFERGASLLWHWDIKNAEVVFDIAGVRAAARTDRDGVVRALVRPGRTGVVPFTARLRDRADAPVARGRLWVLDPSRPVAVVDIDQTLSNLHEFLVPFRGAEAKTFADAPELIREVARHHQVIYLTARDDAFDASTRTFLRRHGFPDAPIIYNDLGVTTGEERSQLRSSNHHHYKIAAIEGLRDRGLDVRFGIGNSQTDVLSYEGTGIDSYILTDEPGSGPSFRFERYADLRPRLVADGHLPASPGIAGAVAGP